ncbi:MAG TPA: hypothetical protein VN426_10445 [Syntrophomonadaceae bacterium]|nr:hypothetical protein [Syntrophomonadaceae bacterium]
MQAYVGEYASGKSEMAINQALELSQAGRLVTLVDLDTVEPFYTLRPLREYLQERGLQMIGLAREDSFGLGETGAMLNPQARWVLRREGDIIMDIGYGVQGARTLNLVEGADLSSELQIIAVINYSRPMTNSPERIKEYIESLGRVDAIVANTHLGDETTVELIHQGNLVIYYIAQTMEIPIAYAAVDRKFEGLIDPSFDNIPIKYITRYMPGAIW